LSATSSSKAGSIRLLSPAQPSFETVRALVLCHGWNSTAYQILNPGIHHWLNADASAAAGYIERSGFLLVAGAPVCDVSALSDVVREFEAFARERHCRVCYVCAAERMRKVLAGSGNHSSVIIGAQPVWDPRDWARIVEGKASLRGQIQRARNKGVEVGEIPVSEGCLNDELRGTLKAWLASRALPPMRFLVEPNALELCAPDRVLLAARRKTKIVAFLLASPVAARNGYLIEQVARLPDAPNGTNELLIHAAMKLFGERGYEYATLGLVALAEKARDGIRTNPGWLRAMMTMARRHANRFYNFEGLENFRTKMNPQRWEPVYAISNEPSFSPYALYAIGAAFSGISPWKAIAIALWRALRKEISGSAASKES
jgi:phosphatidylglycerol lysyltransferase